MQKFMIYRQLSIVAICSNKFMVAFKDLLKKCRVLKKPNFFISNRKWSLKAKIFSSFVLFRRSRYSLDFADNFFLFCLSFYQY